MVVPRDVTVEEFGLRFVHVIEPNGSGGGLVARRRRIAVRPLAFQPADFEVISGLSAGEEISITAARELRRIAAGVGTTGAIDPEPGTATAADAALGSAVAADAGLGSATASDRV